MKSLSERESPLEEWDCEALLLALTSPSESDSEPPDSGPSAVPCGLEYCSRLRDAPAATRLDEPCCVARVSDQLCTAFSMRGRLT